MSDHLKEKYAVDVLASEAGGYFAPPSKEDLAYVSGGSSQNNNSTRVDPKTDSFRPSLQKWARCKMR